MVEEAKPKSKIKQFLSTPIGGVTATFVGMGVGVIVTVVIFILSREYRDLRVYVHRTRAIISQTGQTSSLSFTSGGKPVERDVTAVRVSIWNKGNKSIKREHVLRPFVIKTGEKFPILEAKILKQSREVAEIKLKLSRMKMGEIEVDWDILEHNDGAVIQLIYLGPMQVPIKATSTIEGQEKIKEDDFFLKVENLEKDYYSLLFVKFSTYSLIIIGILYPVFFIGIIRSLKRKKKRFYIGLPKIHF